MNPKIITLLSLVLIFVFSSVFYNVGVASASTIFTDNFEDYDIGPLNGQGGWVPTYYVYMYAPRKSKAVM